MLWVKHKWLLFQFYINTKPKMWLNEQDGVERTNISTLFEGDDSQDQG